MSLYEIKNFKQVVFVDFETKSRADLKKVGARLYSKNESTDILCVGFKTGNKKYYYEFWKEKPKFHKALINILNKPDTLIVAHNWTFDYYIFKNVLEKKYRIFCPDKYQWSCTMSTAYRNGLPGALADLGKILKIEHIKKAELGKALIRKFSKPGRNGEFKTPDEKEAELLKIYNDYDIEGMEDIFNLLPRLDKDRYEWPIFQLDKEINFCGIHTDNKRVLQLIKRYEELTEKAQAEAEEIAGRANEKTLIINSPIELKNWINKELKSAGLKIKIENAQAFTLSELEKGLKKITPDIENKLKKTKIKSLRKEKQNQVDAIQEILKLLKLKPFLAGAAAKKLYRFRDLVDGNFVYNTLQYYGAGPGRFAGRDIQPHNFPRNCTKDFEADFDKFMNVDEYDKDLLNSLLRGLFIPRPGNVFCAGDFSQIEARLVLWVAGSVKGVNAFRNNEPIYEQQAALIFNINVNKIGKKSEKRTIGKMTILGCGYGMGPDKFQGTCETVGGVKISIELAEKAVKTYRTQFKEVPHLWRTIERDFIKCLETGKPVKHERGFYKFERTKHTVKMIRLSGRHITYFKPRVQNGKLKYYHSKKGFMDIWGGVLTENLIQAMAGDILVHSMFEMKKEPLLKNIVLTVHDEDLTETKRNSAKQALEKMKQIMNTPPEWASTLPLAAEVEIMERYGK